MIVVALQESKCLVEDVLVLFRLAHALYLLEAAHRVDCGHHRIDAKESLREVLVQVYQLS